MSGEDNRSMKDSRSPRESRVLEEISGTVWDSYRAILEGALVTQERNVELTLRVFEGGMEAMEQGVEFNRRATQELAKRMREQRESYLALSRESTDAYAGFLDSLSEFYGEFAEGPEASPIEEDRG